MTDCATAETNRKRGEKTTRPSDAIPRRVGADIKKLFNFLATFFVIIKLFFNFAVRFTQIHYTMANITFTPGALERYNKCLAFTEAKGDKTLSSCINRLAQWDGEIRITKDFDEMSFFFRQVYSDGREGICGGIIYHGARDGYGSGQAATFSVCLTPTEGYQIHT